MSEKIEFFHDTHQVSIHEAGKGGTKRRVYSGYGHYHTTYHPAEASCKNCKFYAEGEGVCTVKMDLQLKCGQILNGDCGHMRTCVKDFSGCKSGGGWAIVDREADDYFGITPIQRALGDTIHVPTNGLCHVYKKKELNT